MQKESEIFNRLTSFRFNDSIAESRQKKIKDEIVKDTNDFMKEILTKEERKKIKGKHVFKVDASNETKYHKAFSIWQRPNSNLTVGTTHIHYENEAEAVMVFAVSRKFSFSEDYSLCVKYAQQKGPGMSQADNGFIVEIEDNKKHTAKVDLFVHAMGENAGAHAISPTSGSDVNELLGPALESMGIDMRKLGVEDYNSEVVKILRRVIFTGKK